MYSPLSKLTLAMACLCVCTGVSGQIAIGTMTPDPGAILTVASSTKGVLIPRLTTAQQSTLAGTLTATQKGMLVTDATSGQLLAFTGTSFTAADNLTATTPLTVSATNKVALNGGTNAGDLITWDGANWVNMQPATQHFSFAVDNHQPYLVMNYCIALQGIFPARSDSEPFVSQIQLFPFNFAPTGWALCNGQLLAISQNTALFSLLGTTFGGNGTSNFALPDLQGRVALNLGNGPGLQQYIEGEAGGVETNTIAH
jgi:microcystin-dependent protein